MRCGDTPGARYRARSRPTSNGPRAFPWLASSENSTATNGPGCPGLLRLNSPIVKGYLLKEDFRRPGVYRRTDGPTSGRWRAGADPIRGWPVGHSRG